MRIIKLVVLDFSTFGRKLCKNYLNRFTVSGTISQRTVRFSFEELGKNLFLTLAPLEIILRDVAASNLKMIRMPSFDIYSAL